MVTFGKCFFFANRALGKIWVGLIRLLDEGNAVSGFRIYGNLRVAGKDKN